MSSVNTEVSNETSNGRKRIEDVDSLDQLDFNQLDMVMGDTPEDIKQTCLSLCKEYLSGNWSQQTLDTIEVKRVSGGLTNQLYYCGINKPVIGSDVPQEVAVRLYGSKFFNTVTLDGNDRLNDTIISSMVSENKLGPKIYGLFEKGQIQHYYHHRQFQPEEQKDSKLVTEVFQKLARIHAMDVPIKRHTNWLYAEFEDSYQFMFEGNIPIRQWFTEYNCQISAKCDFKAEIAYIKDVMAKLESPIVFAHNDYRSSNLMITENNNNTDDRIVVCDFEYSSYGYRGLDFVTLSVEWGRKAFDYFSVEGLPQPDDVLKPLVEIYIKESERIFGKQFSQNKINSLQHILKEIKVCLMVWNFLGGCVMIKNLNKKSFTKKVIMEMMENSFKNYLIIKQRLKDMKLIE